MSDDKSAGCLGLNCHNQIVWAGDNVHVTRDQQYRCMCEARCGCALVLKRGKKLLKSGKPMAPHFAYPPSSNRTGCMGIIPTPEAIKYNEAKWLIKDKLSEFTFWDVCGAEHRVGTSHQFKASEWIATVEKTIPGTKRIADVLLHNIFTLESVAIEVCNTHKVCFPKAEECLAVNVHIIEVFASTVNFGIRVLNNQRTCHEWDKCEKCVQEKRNRAELRAQRELDRKRDETVRAQKELDRKREETLDREQRERDRVELVELGKRNREREKERKREDQSKRREHHEVQIARQKDLDHRSRLPKPRNEEQKRVDKMRGAYKRLCIKIKF